MSGLKYSHLPYQECPSITGGNLKAAIILVKCIIRKSQPPVTTATLQNQNSSFTCEEVCQSVQLYRSDHLDFNLTYFKILRKFKPLISVITMDFCAIATGQNHLEESSEVHTKDRITWAPALFFLICVFLSRILQKRYFKSLQQHPLESSGAGRVWQLYEYSQRHMAHYDSVCCAKYSCFALSPPGEQRVLVLSGPQGQKLVSNFIVRKLPISLYMLKAEYLLKHSGIYKPASLCYKK